MGGEERGGEGRQRWQSCGLRICCVFNIRRRGWQAHVTYTRSAFLLIQISFFNLHTLPTVFTYIIVIVTLKFLSSHVTAFLLCFTGSVGKRAKCDAVFEGE